MRTVMVYPAMGGTEVEGVLDRLGPTQRRPWHIDGCLHVSVLDPVELFLGWEGDALERVVGGRPSLVVMAHVSWAVDGRHEVRKLALALLRDGGAAIDDYSPHPWTCREIAEDRTVDGRRFFRKAT